MTDAMRTTAGLLDTSVVIALDQISPGVLPHEPVISSITLAELAAGPHATDDDVERARRQERLQLTEGMLEALSFDAAAARAYGRLYAATRSAGRKPRGARALDLLIASVALAHGLPLYTKNPRDFDHLDSTGLEVHEV